MRDKIKELEGIIEYERHKYNTDIENTKIAYAQNLKRRLLIEIDGMMATLKYVEEPWKGKLLRRIKNIENILL